MQDGVVLEYYRDPVVSQYLQQGTTLAATAIRGANSNRSVASWRRKMKTHKSFVFIETFVSLVVLQA